LIDFLFKVTAKTIIKAETRLREKLQYSSRAIVTRIYNNRKKIVTSLRYAI